MAKIRLEQCKKLKLLIFNYRVAHIQKLDFLVISEKVKRSVVKNCSHSLLFVHPFLDGCYTLIQDISYTISLLTCPPPPSPIDNG